MSENNDVVENEGMDQDVAEGAEVEETDLEKAVRVVATGIKHDVEEDDIKIMLVKAGFGFRKAGRMYDKAAEQLGIQMSSAVRYEQVSELFEGYEFEISEWPDVLATADFIVENIEMTTQKQALASLKKYAKENGITLPEKPKRVKGEGGGRATGFRTDAFNWMVANPNASDKDLIKYCTDNEKNKPQLHKNLCRIFNLCKRYHKAASA